MTDRVTARVKGVFERENNGKSDYFVTIADQYGRSIYMYVPRHEAVALAAAFDGTPLARPMMVDVLLTSIAAFDVEVAAVVIADLVDGVYLCQIELRSGVRGVTVDACASDAFEVALRSGCGLEIEEAVFVKLSKPRPD